MGAGIGGRRRTSSLVTPHWASFRRPIGTRPTSPRTLTMITTLGALAALALAARAHQEVLAAGALAGSVILLIALRWPSGVAMALIPVAVACTAFLHSLLPAVVLAAVLALAAVVLFAAGLLRVRLAHLGVAVMAVTILVAYLIPAARLQSTSQTRQVLTWILAGLVVLAVSIASPPSAPALLRVILLTGAIAAVVALVQGEYVEGRLQGLGLNPNYLAVYLAVPIVISVGLALRPHGLLWLSAGATCLPALLASRSREGFLAMVTGIAFVVIQGRTRAQQMLMILAFAAAVVVLPGDLASISSLGAGGRASAELNYDNLLRARVALFAVHVALSHPLLGIGFGQFPAYAAVSSALGLYITTTNEYLLLAAETGAVALAAFLLLLWFAVRGARHGAVALVRAAVVTCAVSMLFIDSFSSPVVAVPFWICLGTLLARGQAPDVPTGNASAYEPHGKEMTRCLKAEERSPQELGLLSVRTGNRSSSSSTRRESGWHANP